MNMKLNKQKLRQIIKESIEQYLRNGDLDTIVSNHFSINPCYRNALFEAAFLVLGYDRFAVDGELLDKYIDDEPWDDAYLIIEWAVKNKGLDEKYLGKLNRLHSNMNDDEFREYSKQINNGKSFWFTKQELSEILGVLPKTLQQHLVKDMVNAGRIQKVLDTANHIATMNNGENLSVFLNTLKELMKGKKWKTENLREPVKQAMKISNILPNK